MSEPPRTIGYLTQVACTWEVLARKAGNVCPGREYPDLTVNDFLASAAAIAPVMDEAPSQPIGVTVLRAIEATRRVVKTNTNLGIVLLLAPLASVPLGEPLQAGVARKLDETTVEDSHNIYEAIRLANPSGLGRVSRQDISTEPTLPLRQVMALAKSADKIAAQYVSNFNAVLNLMAPELVRQVVRRNNIEWGIAETQLWWMAAYLDSHVLRKRSIDEALEVRERTQYVLHVKGLDSPNGQQAYLTFDAWLRADNHARNPGTTADLIVASLFAALREGHIALTTPFVWEEHPFAMNNPGPV